MAMAIGMVLAKKQGIGFRIVHENTETIKSRLHLVVL